MGLKWEQFVVAAVTVGAIATTSQAASAYDDNFSDGVRGSQWSSVVDNPGSLSLNETSGRLDLISTGTGASTDDALYLSNFRLSTAADFHVRIGYQFGSYQTAGPAGTGLALAFGVGRDADGTDSAAVGQGWQNVTFLGNTAGGTVVYRTDDQQTIATAGLSPFAVSGVFDLRYDAANDDLTLQSIPYAFPDAGVSYVLADTVRGIWGAADLFVSFGGRGNGYSTTAGQAAFNDFEIVSGTVLIPEPACLTGLAVAGMLLRRRC